MSDKLVVEFFPEDAASHPLFAGMSLHGGDNPVSASLTIADFIASLRTVSPKENLDPYELASRFILWSSTRNEGSLAPEAELIPVSEKYGYQTARIFVGKRIRVEIVPDEFSTDQEMAEGAKFLKLVSVS